MIIDHNHPAYREKLQKNPAAKYNGAFYYSKEIVKNMIPLVQTDRNWVTLNIKGVAADHSIVFIHNNLHPERYDWLKDYEDLILVCGVPETCMRVSHLGRTLYLPLSIDVEYVSQFKAKTKLKRSAFVGRRAKIQLGELPDNIDYLTGLRRQALLPRLARYESVYAVGRCALEARCLECEVLPYDSRFPDPTMWQVVDNKDAALMLNEMIRRIDG